jgi:hypothetical protein
MYSGWELELSERRKIYAAIKPVYNDVYPHYLVHQFNATEPPTATSGTVIGWWDKDEGEQLVIFQIDGALNRPDGSLYRLSWSRDHTKLGVRKPLQSWVVPDLSGWQRLDQPFTVNLVPGLIGMKGLINNA